MNQDLTRAAEILERYAGELFDCHTNISGDWDEDAPEVRADHDEYIALATRLRRAAHGL